MFKMCSAVLAALLIACTMGMPGVWAGASTAVAATQIPQPPNVVTANFYIAIYTDADHYPESLGSFEDAIAHRYTRGITVSGAFDATGLSFGYGTKVVDLSGAQVSSRILQYPTDDQVASVCSAYVLDNGEHFTYDPATQTIVWYVVKSLSDGWHIDGLLVPRSIAPDPVDPDDGADEDNNIPEPEDPNPTEPDTGETVDPALTPDPEPEPTIDPADPEPEPAVEPELEPDPEPTVEPELEPADEFVPPVVEEIEASIEQAVEAAVVAPSEQPAQEQPIPEPVPITSIEGELEVLDDPVASADLTDMSNVSYPDPVPQELVSAISPIAAACLRGAGAVGLAAVAVGFGAANAGVAGAVKGLGSMDTVLRKRGRRF